MYPTKRSHPIASEEPSNNNERGTGDKPAGQSAENRTDCETPKSAAPRRSVFTKSSIHENPKPAPKTTANFLNVGHGDNAHHLRRFELLSSSISQTAEASDSMNELKDNLMCLLVPAAQLNDFFLPLRQTFVIEFDRKVAVPTSRHNGDTTRWRQRLNILNRPLRRSRRRQRSFVKAMPRRPSRPRRSRRGANNRRLGRVRSCPEQVRDRQPN